MLKTLLDRRGARSEFVAEARQRGLSRRMARLIEPSARHVHPDDPGLVLQSRELLERTALHAAAGDHGNLELSYRRVDRLAAAFEELALTRVTDIPDPFRRVWVRDAAGQRTEGVALTCENGEIAIFCPPAMKQLAEGTTFQLSYRGFNSSVRMPLVLSDSCLFPGGLMLHLVRPGGEGAIGRAEPRHDVRLAGSVRRLHAQDGADCEALDMSLSGVRIRCAERFDVQEILACTLWFGADPEPFAFDAIVRWLRPADSGPHQIGIEFQQLSAAQVHRLEVFLTGLGNAQTASARPADEDRGDAPEQADEVVVLELDGPAAEDAPPRDDDGPDWLA